MLTQTPQGFYGVKNLAGGFVRKRVVRGGIASGYGTNIFVGDPVKLMTTGTFELAAASKRSSTSGSDWK